MKIKLNDDSSKLSIKMSSAGGESEVTKAYVDNQDNSILADAKSYTEQRLNLLTIPTKTSQLTNDSGFINKHQDISNLATKSSVEIIEGNVMNNANQLLLLSTKTDSKQDKLTAGTNITISGNVISSVGGSGTSYDDTAVRGLIADNKNAIALKVSKSELGSELTSYVTAHKNELKGDTGAQGPKGDTGLTGATGPKGETGPQGPQGIQGPKGDDGAKGEQGLQGPKGDDGEKGADGIQGPKGDTGAQGLQGAKGETGEKGADGAQGPKGDSGYSPVRSVDYWTAEDIASMKAYIDDAILGGSW